MNRTETDETEVKDINRKIIKDIVNGDEPRFDEFGGYGAFVSSIFKKAKNDIKASGGFCNHVEHLFRCLRAKKIGPSAIFDYTQDQFFEILNEVYSNGISWGRLVVCYIFIIDACQNEDLKIAGVTLELIGEISIRYFEEKLAAWVADYNPRIKNMIEKRRN